MQPDSRIHWSSYPALLLAVAFAAGIVWESFATIGLVAWMAGAGAGAIVGLGSYFYGRQHLVSLAPLGRVVALAALAVCAGGARQAAYLSPPPRSVASLSPILQGADLDARLAGVVDGVPTEAEGTWRFPFRLSHLRTPTDSAAVAGRVQVTLHNPMWISTIRYPTIREGDRLHVQGRLEAAPAPRNPGAFDYGAYLQRRGICCTVYVQGEEAVQIAGNVRGPVDRAVTGGRDYVGRQIDRYVPGAISRTVLRALLLGDRTGLGPARREQFASTGLMHLLAVSGLHVLLVGMVLYRLLRPMLMRIRLPHLVREGMRAGLTLTVLVFYMLLTGARPSVVRAVVMAAVLIGGLLVQRSSHTLNSLGVAALVLLAFRPPALFDAGFQLSMSAVAAIVTLHPRITERIPERMYDHPAGNWAISLLSVSTAATLGTAPVLLYHFGRAQIAGLVLNLPAIPLTATGLTAGILCVIVGGAFPALGSAFGAAADLFLRGLVETARWGAVWFEWGLLSGRTPEPMLLVATGAVLVMAAQWPRPRTRWRLAILTSACFCIWVWAPILTRESRPHLDLVFLDVGQGDAVHLATPNGRHLLVDTGPRTRFSDAGRRILLPYFQSRGIQHLDAVVVTHPDSDHLGGLPTLLRSVSIGKVFHSGWKADTRLYAESQRLLDSLSVSHRPVQAGDTIGIDSSVGIQVLGPPVEKWPGAFGENDASVVLRATYGDTRVLLTGDVESAAEDWLVNRYGTALASDIVKIPHHGSSTSSTGPFVAAATADRNGVVGVVPVGERNAFGFPDPSVLRRWGAAGVQVHLTSDTGAVWLRTDGQTVRRIDW